MRKIQLYKELQGFVHGEYEEVQVYLKLNEIHLANFSALREQEAIHRPLRDSGHASVCEVQHNTVWK